ncbi:MAG TPA: peptidase U32 family protein [Treponemataceae bacterium]|nr:peptidase U32 family protein [Treponemataceae bacterium]
MELVSPAGNIEKLTYAWEYGADSAYIGLKKFSLRIKADNFHGAEHEEIRKLKAEYAQRGIPKRLLCALNISFHNKEIEKFLAEKDYFHAYPIDAFIVQDIGMVRLLQKEFPTIPLHLSTQANCINSNAVKMYKDLGFKRVVLGRETSLTEIAEIKQAVPEMEIECFAHGAMCIAYSGRCLMSAYLTGRSANAGHCSHSCRWDYRLLADELKSGEREYAVEERARPGEIFPVIEDDDFTALFSSKDLCMIDHLEEMKKAGVDALKIEGRMKSLYYAAVVTRAYRKRIDQIEKKLSEAEAFPFVAELDRVAHREFATGFYYSKDDANKTTKGETTSPWQLAGTIGAESTTWAAAHTEGQKDFIFNSMNKITTGTPLEYIGPDTAFIADTEYSLIDPATGQTREWVCHGHPCLIRTNKAISERFIVRSPDPDYKEESSSTQSDRIPKSMRNLEALKE